MVLVRTFLRRMPRIRVASFSVVDRVVFSSVARANDNFYGSIQGLVTDPSGAVVSDAKISISNKATGRVIIAKSTSAGRTPRAR